MEETRKSYYTHVGKMGLTKLQNEKKCVVNTQKG